MTRTAEPLATGPFHGFFSEGATLYRLDPPCLAGGPTKRHGVQTREVSHVIVSGMPEDEWGNGPETAVFAADEQGVVDSDYYLTFGTIIELSVDDTDAALARLGYAQ
jgi:hypothetical protein